jgi:SAM-dependent methyltransferase
LRPVLFPAIGECRFRKSRFVPHLRSGNIAVTLNPNAMETESLNLICCPKCQMRLSLQIPSVRVNGLENSLFCSHCRIFFPVVHGMPAFIMKDEQVSYGLRMDLMRVFYSSFYTPLTNMLFLLCGGPDSARHEVIDRLEVPDGALVLETGIGTGDNLPYLHARNSTCTCFGIDNQHRMLKQCYSKLRNRKMKAELFLADAEQLPFRDHMFDVVFHLGAINIFPNKKRAILEMIRVAKPGTRIIIADETQKAGKLFEFFIGKQPEIVPPVDLVPHTMLDIRMETIWKGYGYVIEFRTPG